MFISLKDHVHDEEVRQLLAYRALDVEQLKQTIDAYENEDFLELYGIAVDGEITGLIGYEYQGEGTLLLRDLVVKPEWRGLGYGRGLILETIALEEPQKLVVETDDETAVEFFRNIGFTIYSRGLDAFGGETFQCIYECT
jgi:Acetyltransferases